jgi:hypothetical protein
MADFLRRDVEEVRHKIAIEAQGAGSLRSLVGIGVGDDERR